MKLETEWNADTCTLLITLPETLSIDTVPNLWAKANKLVKYQKPKIVTVEAKALTYCDSAGASFIILLHAIQSRTKREFKLEHLPEQYKTLVNLFEKDEQASQKASVGVSKKYSIPVRVGMAAVEVAKLFKMNTIYLGELSAELVSCVRSPSLIRWKDLWHTIEIVGPNCLPIVLLLGFLLGLILSFQSAIPLEQFGAVIYVANIVAISLARELAPLMVAIILAGRTASSFAAEIGTMKVNQEIDALRTMGLKPMVFLAVPRVLAVTMMAPLLTIFMLFIALIGSMIFMTGMGFSPSAYFEQIQSAVTLGDFLGGVFKSVIFGLMIGGIGCMHGLRTKFGASAVGESTTIAVVSCIIMLVVIDGLIGILFYITGL